MMLELFISSLRTMSPDEIMDVISMSEDELKTMSISIEQTHPELCCPITQELMLEPCYYEINGRRYTFERSAIERWHKIKGTCPLTRADLRQVLMNSDYETKRIIRQTMAKQLPNEPWISENLREHHAHYEERIFQMAIKHGYISLLKQFSSDQITNYINKVWNGWKPIHYAAGSGNVEVFEYLLASGADATEKTLGGLASWRLAFEASHVELTKYILIQSANMNPWDKLMEIFESAGLLPFSEQKCKILTFLLEKLEPNEMNFQNLKGNTILHYLAPLYGKTELVALALKKGADVNIRNRDGNTAIHRALSSKQNEIVALLITQHAELIGANFRDFDLRKIKLNNLDLSKAHFIGAYFDNKALLSAGRLCDIKVDLDTLFKKNQYTANDLLELKKKIVSDYKVQFSNSNNFRELLNTLSDIMEDETHLLKIERKDCASYGNTDAYAAVIDYGRAKLLKLAKQTNFEDLGLDDSEKTKLNAIFNKNTYSLGRRILFFGQANNTKEALNHIQSIMMGSSGPDINYHFYVRKHYVAA